MTTFPLLVLEGAREIDVVARAGPSLAPAQVLAATGWEVKPHGLCRGDVCNPGTFAAGPVLLADLAAALHRPLAFEQLDGRGVAVLGEAAGSTALPGELIAEFALSTVDGDPVAITGRGRKTAVVVWSTWCGCRYELPSWQKLADELAGDGLDLVTVALDDDAEAVRKWTSRVAGLLVAIDPDHRVCDLFGVVNVPATVWLDGDGRMVKAPTIAPGDDQFREFTDVDSSPHHDALRAWVRGGAAPKGHVSEDSDQLRAARTERRLASWLHRHGHAEAAERHYAAAVELAPLDFSIRRASMPARGRDPFVGEDFLALWEDWSAAGRPGYVPTTSA
jgi:thiol-disulfide isomerase/thioredoxin